MLALNIILTTLSLLVIGLQVIPIYKITIYQESEKYFLISVSTIVVMIILNIILWLAHLS